MKIKVLEYQNFFFFPIHINIFSEFGSWLYYAIRFGFYTLT